MPLDHVSAAPLPAWILVLHMEVKTSNGVIQSAPSSESPWDYTD